ncbi:MAG TPA: exodeoxyribonuclease VII small subunit [Candidatus Thiothrix moscowensis]|uniref:exodeoxyribonuclease VII small subunit n=1 Tax=unclassified Thiothrix TaxID=2636184 RepID=UPI0025D31EB5|nr:MULTISPECIES: exodeoxyribonuclease VII small subunit [unclassified Thiothrix]HRJ51166.1 exodeoxyribonuclease VII small subunit [Candidatus Thiothrix moscowensis]HRJ91779.1 exodeoxyribonuclease VII small subunit [Candidatus Thiothrix moscowensis]
MPRKQSGDAVAPLPDFETAMAELEALVQRMESGDLSLEDSLREFERGVQLTRICQDVLKVAEQRVKLLSTDGQERDFPPQREA